MSQWLPRNAVRKGFKNPVKALKYIKTDWIDETRQQIRSGFSTANLTNQADFLAGLRQKDNFCLIVLDACRFDALNSNFSKYFKGYIKPSRTVATNTFEYLQYNWHSNYEYPYVSAATPVTSEKFDFDGGDSGAGLPQEDLYKYYRGYIPANHFQDLDEVWRNHWDEQLRVCPPEPTTEQGIERARNTSRMVVHYFQPHAPFIGSKRPNIKREKSGINDNQVQIDQDVWRALKSGEISKKKLREYYNSNLERALAAVLELVKSTNFEHYVIIGDHGEALGEYGGYAHSIQHPYVSKVPWATIEGVVDGAPEMWKYDDDNIEGDMSTTRSRLQDLGYIE